MDARAAQPFAEILRYGFKNHAWRSCLSVRTKGSAALGPSAGMLAAVLNDSQKQFFERRGWVIHRQHLPVVSRDDLANFGFGLGPERRRADRGDVVLLKQDIHATEI